MRGHRTLQRALKPQARALARFNRAGSTAGARRLGTKVNRTSLGAFRAASTRVRGRVRAEFGTVRPANRTLAYRSRGMGGSHSVPRRNRGPGRVSRRY